MRLSNKVALITGSGRGIGRAIAERFAREGADVVINYGRHADEAEETRAAVAAAGRQAHVIQADVSQAEEVRRLVEDGAKHFGRLDILVNNAGVEVQAPFLEAKEDDYDRVLNVNLKGVFFACQTFARLLIAAKRPGKIINISSVHEEIPFPGHAAYCASKGGMRLLTRDLAVELAPHQITVNAIAPGAIATEINRQMENDKPRMEALVRQIPLGRLGQPQEVAGVAAFLASDDASYVTASTYFVDGGLTWDYKE